jgi:hypothetical protein
MVDFICSFVQSSESYSFGKFTIHVCVYFHLQNSLITLFYYYLVLESTLFLFVLDVYNLMHPTRSSSGFVVWIKVQYTSCGVIVTIFHVAHLVVLLSSFAQHAIIIILCHAFLVYFFHFITGLHRTACKHRKNNWVVCPSSSELPGWGSRRTHIIMMTNVILG